MEKQEYLKTAHLKTQYQICALKKTGHMISVIVMVVKLSGLPSAFLCGIMPMVL